MLMARDRTLSEMRLTSLRFAWIRTIRSGWRLAGGSSIVFQATFGRRAGLIPRMAEWVGRLGACCRRMYFGVIPSWHLMPAGIFITSAYNRTLSSITIYGNRQMEA